MGLTLGRTHAHPLRRNHLRLSSGRQTVLRRTPRLMHQHRKDCIHPDSRNCPRQVPRRPVQIRSRFRINTTCDKAPDILHYSDNLSPKRQRPQPALSRQSLRSLQGE
ncbi:hypothetical protein [Anthocerotibacter panamensis]|uniref:hypothetical protein n=1 Tax=Anthocerotibacter panamensis TaxID=2857077 RepID=UPI001C405060|nr:hypothetical protein [Anthocerotibacter panamensis]